MSGRILKITDGGILRFYETNENGTFHVDIVVPGDLTANRTLILDNKDGVVGGLGVGEYYDVPQGGTGVNTLAAGGLLFGNGTGPVQQAPTPTVDATALFWDGILDEYSWAPIDFTGTEATTARNISLDQPGPYVHKLGSELRFRNILGGTGMTVTQSDTALTIGYDANTFTLPGSQLTGSVPATRGGTGQTSIGARQILVGNASGGWDKLAAPSAPGMVLQSNSLNSAVVWDKPRLKEHESGEIKYPETDDYILCLSFPYAGSLDKLTTKTAQGSLTYTYLCNGITIATGTATSTKTSVTITGKNVAVGDQIVLLVSNVLNSCRDFSWTLEFARS